MARPASKMARATYDDVVNAPPEVVAEILGGELVLTPRPSPRHAMAESRLFHVLSEPFVDGVGGPGGWVLLNEPELHFATEGLEVVVPDVAGWRRERLPEPPETAAIKVVPDWVCEILSPRTEKRDRSRKMDIYAREKVGHVWLLHPDQRLVEVYRRVAGGWEAAGAEPFDAVALDLAKVWKW
jgi:Uma2 family endonuclease